MQIEETNQSDVVIKSPGTFQRGNNKHTIIRMWDVFGKSRIVWAGELASAVSITILDEKD